MKNPFRQEWQDHLAQALRYAAATDDNLPHLRRICAEAGATEEDIAQLEREGREGGAAFIQRILDQQPTPHLMTDVHA